MENGGPPVWHHLLKVNGDRPLMGMTLIAKAESDKEPICSLCVIIFNHDTFSKL